MTISSPTNLSVKDLNDQIPNQNMMPLGEDYGEEVQGAVFGAFLALYVGILAPTLAEATSTTSAEASITLPLFVLRVTPDLFSIAGLVVTTIAANPPGLIGWGLETSGAIDLFSGNALQSAVYRLFIGAGIVVVSQRFWKARHWVDLLEWLLSSGPQNSHRRRGGR